MSDNDIPTLLADVYSKLGIQHQHKKESNVPLIASSIVSVLASVIAIACCAVSYVSASRVADMQRETDALRNRVDVAEAYISNLNQRVK